MSTPVVPVVGMGATIQYWSDSHPGTVIAVSPSGAKVTVQEDKATRTDTNGMSDMQSYTYEPDPNGKIHVFHRRTAGREAGHYANRGSRLSLGKRHKHHDYSF